MNIHTRSWLRALSLPRCSRDSSLNSKEVKVAEERRALRCKKSWVRLLLNESHGAFAGATQPNRETPLKIMCMETAKRDPRCHSSDKARQLISTTSVSTCEERRRITPPSCFGLIFREAASKFRRASKVPSTQPGRRGGSSVRGPSWYPAVDSFTSEYRASRHPGRVAVRELGSGRLVYIWAVRSACLPRLENLLVSLPSPISSLCAASKLRLNGCRTTVIF